MYLLNRCGIVTLGMALAATMTVMTGTALAAGDGPTSSSNNFDMPNQRMSPEDQAKQAYNSGVKKLKDAAEYEADAAKASEPKKEARAREKAQKAYEKALKDFTRATDKLPSMSEAWNYVGFTQRHLGDYRASLAAYAKALELKPNYPEAIEYRGEAFLGLNALDDAKQAYLSLYRNARPLSNQLLAAMQTWVAQRKQDPKGIDGATVDAFASWVSERTAIAQQTAATSPDTQPRW